MEGRGRRCDDRFNVVGSFDYVYVYVDRLMVEKTLVCSTLFGPLAVKILKRCGPRSLEELADGMLSVDRGWEPVQKA